MFETFGGWWEVRQWKGLCGVLEGKSAAVNGDPRRRRYGAVSQQNTNQPFGSVNGFRSVFEDHNVHMFSVRTQPEAAQYDDPTTPLPILKSKSSRALRNVTLENPTVPKSTLGAQCRRLQHWKLGIGKPNLVFEKAPRVTEHWDEPVRNPLLRYLDTCYPVVNGLRALGSECRVEFSTGQRVPSQDSALGFQFPSAQGPECRRYFSRTSALGTGRPDSNPGRLVPESNTLPIRHTTP
ncbi:hypothetical protein Bbelb_020650 [Branchiostoma belcheri]|nr:hypothetical protein Bbelb_020650 [Branchiostoma belcheri]